jgi:hypothetical protein
LKFENHQFYNCEITLDNGEQYKISANWLHNNQLDNWKGWQCNAGFHRIDVDKNFDVYSAQCQNDYLGNLFTEWQPLDAPTICKKSRCTGCTDDLLITKAEKLKN